MVLFTINGERNSGTSFLYKLLKDNGFPAFDGGCNYCSYLKKINWNKNVIWKHAVPRDEYKELDERVIDIFIFRELNGWLKSMFCMPYELSDWGTPSDKRNFNIFLKKKNFTDRNRNLSGLNMDDNNKTIFEIRYYKFNKILSYKEKNKDIVFVNLSYLQNDDNANIFLQTLQEKYMKHMKPNKTYITTFPHTKTNKNIKNINRENIINDESENYININKNEVIEEFINDLTFTIK